MLIRDWTINCWNLVSDFDFLPLESEFECTECDFSYKCALFQQKLLYLHCFWESVLHTSMHPQSSGFWELFTCTYKELGTCRPDPIHLPGSDCHIHPQLSLSWLHHPHYLPTGLVERSVMSMICHLPSLLTTVGLSLTPLVLKLLVAFNIPGDGCRQESLHTGVLISSMLKQFGTK